MPKRRVSRTWRIVVELQDCRGDPATETLVVTTDGEPPTIAHEFHINGRTYRPVYQTATRLYQRPKPRF